MSRERDSPEGERESRDRDSSEGERVSRDRDSPEAEGVSREREPTAEGERVGRERDSPEGPHGSVQGLLVGPPDVPPDPPLPLRWVRRRARWEAPCRRPVRLRGRGQQVGARGEVCRPWRLPPRAPPVYTLLKSTVPMPFNLRDKYRYTTSGVQVWPLQNESPIRTHTIYLKVEYAGRGFRCGPCRMNLR